jgi:hypothetical protein
VLYHASSYTNCDRFNGDANLVDPRRINVTRLFNGAPSTRESCYEKELYFKSARADSPFTRTGI